MIALPDKSVLCAFMALLLGAVCPDSMAQRVSSPLSDRQGRRPCCAQLISSLNQLVVVVGDWSLPCLMKHRQSSRSVLCRGIGVIGVNICRRSQRLSDPDGSKEQSLKLAIFPVSTNPL